MIDISKGRYWDLPWSLVSGCTPCSLGCDHCWSAGIAHRFYREGEPGHCTGILTDAQGRFNGDIIPHPERLSIPLKRRKPTVYAIWNDLFHETVPTTFIDDALDVMSACPQHTFLVLTKRAHLIADKIYGATPDHGCRELGGGDYVPNVWWGLTVCNQQEADEKIPVFLQVPGKKFLSIEPMLGPIDLGISIYNFHVPDHFDRDLRKTPAHDSPGIDAIILGGETGPRARPMHPDWVRLVRDQCAAAGVPFFFKGWGVWIQSEYKTYSLFNKKMAGDFMTTTCVSSSERKSVGEINHYPIPTDYDGSPAGISRMERKKNAGRLLDGKEHNDLPWT